MADKIYPEPEMKIGQEHATPVFTQICEIRNQEEPKKRAACKASCPLSASANFLRFIGGKSHLKACSRNEIIFNRIVRCFLMLIFVSCALMHIYFIFTGASGSQTCASVIIITTNVIACAMISIGTCSSRHVGEMLTCLFNLIPPGRVHLVARDDCRRNLTNLAIGSTHLLCLILYIYQYGLREMQALLIGQVIYQDNSISAYCVTVAAIITYRLSCLVILAAAQYYISIQYACFVYAENCARFFSAINLTAKKCLDPQIATEMRSKIEFYNSMQSCINENIGFIPFAVLALVWVVVTMGISSVLMKETVFQLLFGFITIGFAIAGISFQIYWITVTASKSTKAMERSRAIAARIVTHTPSTATARSDGNRGTFQLSPEAVSLAHYLAIDPLTRSQAWDMFEISPFLLLAFCNAVIPFTIMIITTNREFSN